MYLCTSTTITPVKRIDMITKNILCEFMLQNQNIKDLFNKPHDGEKICRYFSMPKFGFWLAKFYETHTADLQKTQVCIEYNDGITEISFTIYDVYIPDSKIDIDLFVKNIKSFMLNPFENMLTDKECIFERQEKIFVGTASSDDYKQKQLGYIDFVYTYQ